MACLGWTLVQRVRSHSPRPRVHREEEATVPARVPSRLLLSFPGTDCCYSVTPLCPTVCDTMDCSMPGFPVHHQLLQLAQTHVHRVSDVIPTISSSVVPFSSRLQSFPASGSFLMSQLFTSDGRRIGASASASVLPVYIQG